MPTMLTVIYQIEESMQLTIDLRPVATGNVPQDYSQLVNSLSRKQTKYNNFLHHDGLRLMIKMEGYIERRGSK